MSDHSVCPNCESEDLYIQQSGRGVIRRRVNTLTPKIAEVVDWESSTEFYECGECGHRWEAGK